MDDNDLPTEINAGAARRGARGQRGVLYLVAACIIVPILTAATLLYTASDHRPQIVFPPEARAGLSITTTGKPPISADLLKRLIEKYDLDPCVIGTKYGAVCEDGEVTFSHGEDVCSDHGGVKEWIECR